jgi:hypothetical protein
MEEQYFTKEKNFLDILKERHQKLYAIINVNSVLSIEPELLIKKNFEVEYLNSFEYNGEIKHFDGIFKNRSGFYLYLSKITLSEINFKIKVYYDVSQLEEVKFFIKNLSKLKETD